MIIVSTESIPGREVSETLGIARGSTVRARNIGRDIFAGLKNIVGGEISEYTKLLADSREQAIERMISDAKRLGADAIVNVRFMTSAVMAGASEMLAAGIYLLLGIIVLILIIYVIVNRIEEKKNERFEKRDF
jgi:uncharacterized protein YbjQ (UPF0145 family)